MKRRILTILMALAGLSGPAGASSVPLPKPAATPDEQAVAFWVKFDGLPSVGEPTGLLGCTADAAGRLTVTWRALPTEIAGDLAMVSRDTVKPGEWHHVEVSFSLMQQRASFYLDGRFQWENDNLNVPHLKAQKDAGPSADFAGAVKELRTWDFAADSDRLRGVYESKKRAKAEANAAKIAALAKENGGKGLFGGGAVFVSPVCSQEPVTPYEIPAYSRLTDEARVLICRGEYEPASFTLWALKPFRVKSIKVNDLKGAAGTIPAKEVDLKLVKRWYRSGTGWIAYHNDRRLRVLVPCLFVNDDDLIRVDEERQRNYIRLDYPEGTRYTDVSDPALNHFAWENRVPFKDADVIQPFAIREAGRNQQLIATVHAPKDAKAGLYSGTVELATDQGLCSLKLVVKVLPFDLPAQPSPYLDTTRSYISHMNSLPQIQGATQAEREDYARKVLKDIRSHNLNHTTGVWNGPRLAQLAREAGFVPDRVFCFGRPDWWWDLFPGVPTSELTAADREKGIRSVVTRGRRQLAKLRADVGKDMGDPYAIGFSEATDYGSLHLRQGEMSDTLRRIGVKVFAHGMGMWNPEWAGDVQDMNSSTLLTRKESHVWHAAGGEMINYADPFPSAENPYWYRRKIGLMMFKEEMDGQMLHGYLNARTPFNEWAEDWGGDGNYRTFCLVYPQRGGVIGTFQWEGARAAYEDVKYLTKLTQVAQPLLKADDVDLRREAKRALLWIESLDGTYSDLDAMRVGAIERILVLQKKSGK